MQFLTRKGPIIFSCLFAVLLIVQTVLIFSQHSATEDKLNSSAAIATEKKGQVDEGQGEASKSSITPADTSSLTTTTTFQILLLLSGLPLLFFLVKNDGQSRERLSNIMHELEESNKTYIFNSLEK